MFELEDIVEIININNLDVNYNIAIGQQGKIIMIDKVSEKNKVYYTVYIPTTNQYRYVFGDSIMDHRMTFTEENLKLIKKKYGDKMYISSQDKVKMIIKYNMSYEDIRKLDITAKKVCNVLINEWYSKKLKEKVIFVTHEIIKGLVHEYGANNFNDIQVDVVKYKDFLLKRR